MLKKKTSYLAADSFRHDHKVEPEMVALTNSSVYDSTWSEQDMDGTSSSTEAVLRGAKKDNLRETKPEHQRQQRGRRSRSPSSVSEGLEDPRHSVLSVNSPAPKARRQQWSAMSFVQMTVVVVALAVAASIALVFTLRDAQVQDQERGRRLEDDSSDTVTDGKNMFEPAVILIHSVHGQGKGARTSGRNNVRVDETVKLGSGSPSTGSIESRESSISALGHVASSSPGSDGVLLLEDGTFGQVRPEGLSRPPPDHASEVDGGRRRPSVSAGGEKRTSAVAKNTDVSSSSSPGKYADMTYAKNGRSLKRFNRRAISKKQGIMGLLNN